MTVLSRGARSRRGGRRPGWLLLTALLVLAIAASSALVFTDRVPLLKLAVILALWAAVVAAFASVIYRRQSDADAAKARDLKMVYDLQLDREIAARREYELTVESQLRRELASELRAQSADEVAALRAELAVLRNNLEILFETELSQRPAIETEHTTVRAHSDWARDPVTTDPGSGRAGFRQEVDADTGENRIIDVHEEPLGRRYLDEEPLQDLDAEPLGHLDAEPLGPHLDAEPLEDLDAEPLGPHVDAEPLQDLDAEPLGQRLDEPVPAPEPRGGAMDYGPSAGAGAHRLSNGGGWAPPEPEPEPAPRHGARTGAEDQWTPAPAEGQWLPAGAPGSNWVPSGNGASADQVPEGEYAAPAPGEATDARHASAAHAAADYRIPAQAPTGNSQHGEGQGQSVAELLARLQATPSAGGRRRRREN